MGNRYYQSEDWKIKRAAVIAVWDGLCERCNKRADVFHVHHVRGLAYDIFEVLCDHCHANHHGKPDLIGFGQKPKRCKYGCGNQIVFAKVGGKWVPMDRWYNSDESYYLLSHRCKTRTLPLEFTDYGMEGLDELTKRMA